MLFWFYNFVTILLIPFYLALLTVRFFLGKETFESIKQRFGFSYERRPKGRLIWLHAASVGESMVAMTIVKILHEKYPDLHFLITTITASSSKKLKEQQFPHVTYQFVPTDNYLAVLKFIKYWRPVLGIFIESELWPCLISVTSRKTKLILVNGKLSNSSHKLWQKVPFIFNQMISKFDTILTQSNLDQRKFQNLGFTKSIQLDNLKFINGELPVNAKKLKEFEDQIESKPIMVFASTHLQDDIIITKILSKLKNGLNFYPIIVPRHPKRGEQIGELCKQNGLSYAMRSKGEKFIDKDVYIADTFSELGLFYRISKAVFVGYSFKGKGHNMIEPAYHNNIVIFGPDVNSFQNIADEMIAKKAAIQVQNENDLEELITNIFTSSENYEKYAKNALKYTNSKKNSALKTIEYIEEALK